MEPFLKYLEEKSARDDNHPRIKPIVKEWGLSHTSLEDVFLEVTKRENFTYPEDGHDHNAEGIDVGTEKDFARQSIKVDSKRTSFAFRALIRKNFSLQKRQTGTNCCQIITPILVMAILVILQVIVRTQIGKDVTAITVNTFPIPINVDFNSSIFSSSQFSSSLPSASPSHNPHYFRTGLTPVDTLIGKFVDSVLKPEAKPVENFRAEFAEFSKPSLRRAYPAQELVVRNDTAQNLTNCLEFFFFTKPAATSDAAFIGTLPANGTTKSGFLANIPQKTCLLTNDTVVAVPYYEQKPDPAEMTRDVYDILMAYNRIPIDDLNHPPYNYPLPDGTVQFNSANSQGMDYVMAVNDNQLYHYHRKNNFTRLGLSGGSDQYSMTDTLIIVPGRLALMSMLQDAFRQYVTNVTYSFFNTKYIQLMPYKQEQDIVGFLELPVYLYVLVLEKAEKIREMMGMHGLPKWTYYLSHYIFCFILFMVVIVFFYLVGAVTEIRLFRQTNFIVLFLFLFAWGNALICMSMLFSTFISSKHLVALLGSLIAIVISIGIYNDTTKHMPAAYFIWPQFAFVRGLYLMNNACAANYACYGFPVPAGDEYITCIIALFLDALVYYIIYLYLDQVMPREFGVPKHPLFFLDPFIPSKFWEKKSEESAALIEEPPLRTFHDNQDVDNEMERVKRREYPRDAPLVIEDLAKKYPGADKYSLRGLYLAVESGECFSLLGENGAGKSTAISLLTGLYPPTNGTAAIAGHDITREMDQARLALGVCPQFNVLWDTLTVEEHLLFYARLKGVSPKDEKAHVQEWLIELGLTFAADRPSSSLSGGMKRRVSVGIALVGNPRVVFLDEPTTGLDPASRRHLWTILEKARPGKAIILTTHSMDEAEVLSSRIGIMALGSMRCIGTPHHLKNSIGNLFHLKINFLEENIKIAENFVYSLFPKAILIRTYKGTSEFHISQTGVLVSEVFAKMEGSSERNGIADWSFSQVGLEEVFQMVVEDSHKHK